MANPLLEIISQDKLKLEVGSLIWSRFFDIDFNALAEIEELPPGVAEGSHRRDAAASWLNAMGFEDVRWVQVDDLTLLCLLAYTEPGGNRVQFILEFMGPDASDISLFNYVGEVSN